ncbi:hypothetical protein FNV43_RR06260 [Rhamnella rubrinervis]|uniref:Uncharacterized protein n=1 Tax=Rhamnella rubrinervis TaxID=2594499 RepID=A0A8K0HE73_9ROSA|nr:hypothetical protein FNV43_RR06260 [Rhamnella rubrinervis]
MSSDSDPFTTPYHLLPQRLTLSELQRFQTNTRVSTLLPEKSILITNNSGSDYATDGAKGNSAGPVYILHPDYTVYGDDPNLLPKAAKLEGEPIASCSVSVSLVLFGLSVLFPSTVNGRAQG